MGTVEDIERAVESLKPEDLRKFRDWFQNFDDLRFDEKIERDASSGRLEALADAALRAHRDGKSTPL